mmetsp:Transcript_10333/g.23372  ORF Transcript_10333/g.23372 Transcript_10333/m.23372 type:complete len:217 (+) Transcript_10333:462-1112(+)
MAEPYEMAVHVSSAPIHVCDSSLLATQLSFHACAKSMRMTTCTSRKNTLPSLASHAYGAENPCGKQNASTIKSRYTNVLTAQLPWCTSLSLVSLLYLMLTVPMLRSIKNAVVPSETRYTACVPKYACSTSADAVAGKTDSIQGIFFNSESPKSRRSHAMSMESVKYAQYANLADEDAIPRASEEHPEQARYPAMEAAHEPHTERGADMSAPMVTRL